MKRALIAAALIALAGQAHAQCGPLPYGMTMGQLCGQMAERNLRAMVQEEIARERYLQAHPQRVYSAAEIRAEIRRLNRGLKADCEAGRIVQHGVWVNKGEDRFGSCEIPP